MKKYISALLLIIGAMFLVSSCSMDEKDFDKSIVGTWEIFGKQGNPDVVDAVNSLEITPLSLSVFFNKGTTLYNRYGEKQTTEFELVYAQKKHDSYSSIVCKDEVLGVSSTLFYECTNESLTLYSEDMSSFCLVFKKK